MKMKILNITLVALLLCAGVALGVYMFDGSWVALGLSVGLLVNGAIVSFMRFTARGISKLE